MPKRARISEDARQAPAKDKSRSRKKLTNEELEAKNLICEMCRNFYDQGWVSGTGGGMSIKAGDSIVMAPSGVQKERMQPEDMFILDAEGNVLEQPQAKAPPAKPPKLSECSPLFMAAYELRGAGAVLHSHSLNAVLVTLLQSYPGTDCAGEFRVTNLEMIKGIAGHGYFDQCVVPIIENTARESELTASLRQAIANYPKANAVLVKRHGVYVWGDTWIQAKTQAECYEYLFEAAVKLHSIGIDVSKPPVGGSASQPVSTIANGHHKAEEGGPVEVAENKAKRTGQKPAAIVLDIEGTIAPISFVTETLFPYARQHLRDHLDAHFHTEETQSDIGLLRQEAKEACNESAVGHASDLAGALPEEKSAAIEIIVGYVNLLMTEDRKSTGLKALQGHIWRQGFASGELKADFYPDFVPQLKTWHSQGTKVYIYSSGSREAQKNLFANTPHGDLRDHVSGFFDTTIGPKVVAKSYREIALTLGVDHPAEILFATDNVKEADAAQEAGWQVAVTVKPGNPAIPEEAKSAYRIITDMKDLVQ